MLWGNDGLPFAVVEAKKSMGSPLAGQQQAKLYADCLAEMTGQRPLIYYSNGYEHWLRLGASKGSTPRTSWRG